MRAAELDISLTRLEVTAGSESDMRGLLGVGTGIAAGPERARMQVRIAADNTDVERLHELVAWAERHSPVGDALGRAVPIELEVATG